jgi:ribonuclease Z
MQITLLGTGTPQPNLDRAGPSNHISIGDSSILVDCGSGAVHQMIKAGVEPKGIDHLFITHMHSDHTVDLAHVLITGWIQNRDKPIRIVGPRQTRDFVDRVMHAFEFDIRLRKLHERVGDEIMNIDVVELDDSDTYETDNWKVTAVEVDHGYVKPALGFTFDDGRSKMLISGDTTGCDAVLNAARGVDLLVHELMLDCEFWDLHGENLRELPELRQRVIESHTCPHQLGPIARDSDVPRLALTHFTDKTDERWVREILVESYGGQIIMGTDLTTIKV